MPNTPPIKIGLVGDFDPAFQPHLATLAALEHAADALGCEIATEWLPTLKLAESSVKELERYAGLWIAPGSPYKSLAGALAAIRYARESNVPLIATCGGFQHVVIEYARNVLGISDAEHAEYNPYASRLFISPLSCLLAGKTLNISVTPGTRAHAAYGTSDVSESYYCNFGLNPKYQAELESGGLRVTGTDETGECRILELPGHPFFVATLFLPQLRSSIERPHAIVTAFLGPIPPK